MSKILSVIIPVYNGEEFIQRCLNSIISAFEKVDNFSIELILVDDGSIDNSRDIIKEFNKKYDFIKYYYQHNQGPSAARNFGLDVAIGDYIGFVDCDDTVKPFFFQSLQKAIYGKPDLILFGYEKVLREGKFNFFTPEEKTCMNVKDKLSDVFNEKLLFWYSCTKIYKNSLIKNIRFDSRIRLGEDTIFNLQVVKNSSVIKQIPEILYSYYENLGSLSSPSYKNGLLENMEYHFENRLKVHESLDSVIKLDISKYYLGHILPWLINNIMYLPENERKKELKRIAESNFFTTCTKWKWNVDSKGQYLIIFLLNSRMFNLLNFLLKIKYSSKS
nr:glycosyltransferase [Moraxella sp. CTOTU46934]